MMKVRDCMTKSTVSVSADESVSVAARLLAHYNVGCLPVRGAGGRLRGIVTDRDLVLRCIAAGEDPAKTPVRSVMSGRLVTVSPEDDVTLAAALMSREQVRRLPVVNQEGLCGMVTLGDVVHSEDYTMEAAECLSEITSGVKKR